MPSLPLQLTLEPVLPTRTPRAHGFFSYGYRLRLPDGPALLRADPLLAAFAVQVTAVVVDAHDDEPLQAGVFDPGRAVHLVPEATVDGECEISVWDEDGLRRAGCLSDRAAGIVAAALEVGLEQTAVVLEEDRSVDDDRRDGLDLVIFHPGFVRLDRRPARGYARPARRTRRRLVLVADGRSALRWWDPSGEAGPIAGEELPMSDELTCALRRVQAAFAEHGEEHAAAPEPRGFERFEEALDRSLLHDQALALWRRARAELGREFAIGFLGAGMERPVWSPAELEEEEDEVPF
jgi:hypothetical protein